MDKTIAAASTMPLSNLIVMIIGIIVILVVVAILIKVFNLTISKGTIKSADYEYDQRCLIVNHKIKEDVENIDWKLQKSLREQTKHLSYSISKIGNVEEMCQASRKSLFNTYREPFYNCISNNHFTREFLPSNYDSYRQNLIQSLRAIHQVLYIEYNLDSCKMDDMQDWKDVEENFYALVDEWLIMAMNEVRKSCYEKIDLYETEFHSVEKSPIWKEIIQNCIDKNKNYIKEIDKRLETLR
ncbi:MAG: hypothetical protein IKT89_08260 [Clostridia bacterium]|nr:hypothetical protein [Clostridia bacterium]